MEKAKFDLYYVKHQSLMLDILIPDPHSWSVLFAKEDKQCKTPYWIAMTVDVRIFFMFSAIWINYLARSNGKIYQPRVEANTQDY